MNRCEEIVTSLAQCLLLTCSMHFETRDKKETEKAHRYLWYNSTPNSTNLKRFIEGLSSQLQTTRRIIVESFLLNRFFVVTLFCFFQSLHLSWPLMDLQPKTEPGSPPIIAPSSHRNLKEMNISELFSVLRADFDRAEEVLVARDAKLKAEIGPLQEKIEVERLMRLHAEQELKKKEEQYEKLKMAQDSHEKLSNEVKNSGLQYTNTIEELRNRNHELECENLKPMELNKKWVDDSNAIAELRSRVAELEAGKKSWIDDKNALAALRIKCCELEDANKKNLTTIDKLRAENCKLADEKIKADAKLNKTDVRDPDPLKRNKDIGHSPGASGMKNSACFSYKLYGYAFLEC